MDLQLRSPSEVAAQIWCRPQHSSKEMDVELAITIAQEIDREQAHIAIWAEEAHRQVRNVQYYRGLLEQIGKMIGRDAYICDDESVSEDVLIEKIPDLVKKILDNLGQRDTSLPSGISS